MMHQSQAHSPEALSQFHKWTKELLGQLLAAKVVSQQDCYLHLSEDTLVECNVTPLSLNVLSRLCQQANTQKHYTQLKFNLMREENEGFAKLLQEVNQSNICEANVEIVTHNI
jgi:hypothetical protein